MAEPADLKRRKIAETSLTVLLYVPNDEAHLVGNKQFTKWNQKVVSIVDLALIQIATETEKFLETQEPLKLQAPIEPNNWRRLRADEHHDGAQSLKSHGFMALT